MRLLLPWVLVGALSACATSAVIGDQAGASLNVVFSSAMCGTQTQAPRVTWIGTSTDLRRALESFQARHLPQATPEPPSLDFTRRAAVLLEMGVQPSPGYGLTLQPGQWTVTDSTLVLGVNWLTPPPGRVFAQVITHPCLVVSVPRGGYRYIEVRDQHGIVRMRLGTRADR